MLATLWGADSIAASVILVRPRAPGVAPDVQDPALALPDLVVATAPVSTRDHEARGLRSAGTAVVRPVVSLKPQQAGRRSKSAKTILTRESPHAVRCACNAGMRGGASTGCTRPELFSQRRTGTHQGLGVGPFLSTSDSGSVSFAACGVTAHRVTRNRSVVIRGAGLGLLSPVKDLPW